LALRRSGYEVDVTDTPSGKAPVWVQELIRRIKGALPEWKQFKFTGNDPVAHQLFGARDLGVLKPWETQVSIPEPGDGTALFGMFFTGMSSG